MANSSREIFAVIGKPALEDWPEIPQSSGLVPLRYHPKTLGFRISYTESSGDLLVPPELKQSATGLQLAKHPHRISSSGFRMDLSLLRLRKTEAFGKECLGGTPLRGILMQELLYQGRESSNGFPE
jgi:hypothetical protein